MKVAALWQRLQQRFGMETANLWLVINSHLLRLALGLVSSVAIARALGPAGLSAYAITGTVIMIGITLGKGGLRESSIRALAGRSDQAARPIIRSMVQMRLVGLLIVVLIVVLAAQPLATLLNLPRPAGRDYLWLAALSILATSSSDVIGTLLHARQRFAGLVWSQTVNAALTVPLVVGLFLVQRLTVSSALWVGIVTALASALVSWRLLSPLERGALRPRVALPRDDMGLFRFGKWLWLAEIMGIVSLQIDLLLLNHLVPPDEVGWYALALNLFFKAQIVNQSQYTVLLPEAATLERQAFAAYYRRAVRRNLIFVPAIIGVGVVAYVALPLFYGADFAGTVPLFSVLLLLVLFDLLAEPALLLFYPLNRPRTLSALTAINLIATTGLTLLLVPLMGGMGAAFAKVGGRMIAATVGLSQLVTIKEEEVAQ